MNCRDRRGRVRTRGIDTELQRKPLPPSPPSLHPAPVSMPSDSQVETPPTPAITIHPSALNGKLMMSLFALDRSRLFRGHCVIASRGGLMEEAL